MGQVPYQYNFWLKVVACQRLRCSVGLNANPALYGDTFFHQLPQPFKSGYRRPAPRPPCRAQLQFRAAQAAFRQAH